MENIDEKKLTYKERKKLPKGSFVYPGERKYPISDKAHARNALARVSAHGSEAEKKRVRAAVHRKYPDIGEAEVVKPSPEVLAFLGEEGMAAPQPKNAGVPAAQKYPEQPEEGDDPEKAIKDKQKKDSGYQAAPEPAHAGVPAAQAFPMQPGEGEHPPKAYKGESLRVRPKASWVARQLLDIG
jgi:hypothetical protein